MDTKANINWIKSELDKVEDPSLIKSIVHLLQYRQDKTSREMDGMILEAERDIVEGKLLDQDGLRERMKTWRK